MKNKIELKKYLKITFFVSLCLLFLFLLINIYEYNTYTTNFNNKIVQIVSALVEEYPNLSETEILDILNNSKNTLCTNQYCVLKQTVSKIEEYLLNKEHNGRNIFNYEVYFRLEV